MSSELAAVITTIQPPTDCMRALVRALKPSGAELVVVGDRKGPATYPLDGTHLVTLEDQLRLPFKTASLLPVDRYSRKNLGYLVAIQRGAQCIYETDDDNAPNETWAPRPIACQAQTVDDRDWFNAYRLFCDEMIWPREFPLGRIHDPKTYEHDSGGTPITVQAPIQQALHNGSPDVDAIWRLVLDKPILFKSLPSIVLPKSTWCPFNSQSTWWWPPAFPLMYLPSHCAFRVTDIWRSFIAQRCLWELDHGVVFHAPDVDQERNEHNLIRDFEDEVPNYLRNEELVRALEQLSLDSGQNAVGENLLRCYERLVSIGLLPSREIPLVQSWLADLNHARS